MLSLDEDFVASWLAMQLGLATPDRSRAADQGTATGDIADQQDGIRTAQEVLIKRFASLVVSHQWPVELDETTPLPAAGTWVPPKRRGRQASVKDGSASADEGRPGAASNRDEISFDSPHRYEIRKQIGRGGQARVLLALDKHIGREIAWKEMVDEQGADGSECSGESRHLERFLREVRVTAKLEHPNIVPVYELGRYSDGKPYYTMRLVRGVTLKHKLQACPSLAERMRLLGHFWDVCNAMAFAHANGVIHRDLKPSNIMVGEFGETVLLDWGLAKVRGGDDPRGGELVQRAQLLRQIAGGETVVGAAMGTPSYMSPEQALGEVDEIDERSDVWGLGAVLYEILTGRPPFDNESVQGPVPPQQLIWRATTETPRAALEVCPSAPVELAAVASKSLCRSREDRYQNAREMAEDIAAYMTGRRVAAHEYTSWELVRRFVRRNKAAMSAAVLVLAVIIAALVIVGVAYRRESIAHHKETVAREMEHDERLRAHFYLAQAYANRAERLLADKDLLNARIFAAASLVNNPTYAGSPVYSADFRAHVPESQWVQLQASGQYFQAGRSPVVRLLRTLRGRDAVEHIRFSPDGKLLAATQASVAVSVWNVGDGRELIHLGAAGEGNFPAVSFSPDGGEVATSHGGDHTVEVRSLRTTALIRRLTNFADHITAIAYSPDGGRLAAAERSGQVLLLDSATGKIVGRLAPHSGMVWSASFSADGKWLATASWDKTVHLYDIKQLSLHHTITGHTEHVYDVGFSPDGRTLATAALDRTVQLWDVETGQRRGGITGSDAFVGVTFSPDGSCLATGGFDRTLKVWDSSGSRVLVNVAIHSDQVSAVAFSPDGRLLASGSYDHTVRIWEHVADAGVVYLDHGSRVVPVTYSPDGRLIATGGGKTIRIWAAEGGQLQRQVTADVDVRSLAFSADSKLLASAGPGKVVQLWEVDSGRLRRALPHTAPCLSVAFSPDGKLLASASLDHVARLWEVASGEKLAELKGHTGHLFRTTFSADGRLLATASADRKIGLWDVAARKLLAMLEGHSDWVSSTRFSADGRYLFSSGKDRVAIQWDLATRRPVRRFEGHRQWVNQIDVSRDGQLAATASDDGVAIVWTISTGEPLLYLTGEGLVESAPLSPDGRRIAVSSGKGVRIYPVEPPSGEGAAKMLREAEAAAGMQLKGYQLEPTNSP